MTLLDFVNGLNKLMDERPETAVFEVVTAKDDEGNGFRLVYYEPSVGYYDDNEREFYEEKKANAVCVN